MSHIDCADLSDDQAKDLVGELGQRGIEISGLGYYPNPLHPDLDHRAEVIAHLGHVIEAAEKLGVPVVNTFIGNDKDKPLPENFEEFKKVWPAIVAKAADHGVKIAIENCPMIFSYDEWPGGNNLMYAPATWRDVFGFLDGDTLGLNLDPSHLVWQMIDYERVVREFGDRLYHVHAKDMEIDRDGLYETGRACRPGWAGRSRGCRGSARSAGTASSPRCTRRATTTPSWSSTRTASSRAATRRSRPAS